MGAIRPLVGGVDRLDGPVMTLSAEIKPPDVEYLNGNGSQVMNAIVHGNSIISHKHAGPQFQTVIRQKELGSRSKMAYLQQMMAGLTLDDLQSDRESDIEMKDVSTFSPAGRKIEGDASLVAPPLIAPHQRPAQMFTDSTQHLSPFASKSGASKRTALSDLTERLSSQQRPRKISVSTVESVAAVKIFLETYYDAIYSCQKTPRSYRRLRFIRELPVQQMSELEFQQAYATWLSAESEHLRKDRVFKTRSLTRYHQSGIMTRDYEVVRILGKGSFGVVRLVRERSEPSSVQKVPPNDPTSEVDSDKTSSPEQKGKIYAMKAIRKSEMLRNSQEGHLRAERDFLVASEQSRWVVPLYASFQDYSNLYLVMEYMVGGDFMSLLVRDDVLDEQVAKWYVAEMVLCVEETHAMKWLHRDIKPDNFLISSSGHLKISDFGLAFDGHWAHSQAYHHGQRYSLLERLGINLGSDNSESEAERMKRLFGRSRFAPAGFDGSGFPTMDSTMADGEHETLLDWRNRMQKRRLAHSIVGTSQYMAPEVICGELYDGRCDWWSIGVMLYECLYGFPPFVGQDKIATKERIKEHEKTLQFPHGPRVAQTSKGRKRLPRTSSAAVDLMKQLLRRKQGRLSSQQYALNDRQQRQEGRMGSHASSTTPKPTTDAHFVYPNDAEDIKLHNFFRNIDWTTLHLQRPPFIPDVRDDLTRYFEPEETVIGDGAADLLGSSEADQEEYPDDASPEVARAFADESTMPNSPFARWVASKQWDNQPAPGMATATAVASRKKRVRPQRKPKDILLRDPQIGRTVLDVRKRSAFLGYTYRRPVSLAIEMAKTPCRPSLRRKPIPSFGEP